jgi:hypothetical protein
MGYSKLEGAFEFSRGPRPFTQQFTQQLVYERSNWGPKI